MIDLSSDEKEIIFNIANRLGSDVDGDTIKFFVKEDAGIASLISLPERNQGIDISQREQKLIINIGRQVGCDRDGDILTLFVKESEYLVVVIRFPSFTTDKYKNGIWRKVMNMKRRFRKWEGDFYVRIRKRD